MSDIHTSVQQGTTVKLLFKDGRSPVVGKFREKKSKSIRLNVGKFQIKNLRSMMIYKPQQHEQTN